MGAFGLFLLALGAILRYAITAFVDGVDLATVGLILMIVGGIGIIGGIARGEFGRFWGHSRTERHVSEDGKHVVEETTHA